MHSYHHLPTGKLVPTKGLLSEHFAVRLAVRTRGVQASPVLKLRMIVAAVFASGSRFVTIHVDLVFHEVSVEV
jgi:hypothetical protein